MKLTKEEHKQFIQDCKDKTLYFNYVKHQFKHAESFNEDILKQYHKVYVVLSSCYGNFSGSSFIVAIKNILDSAKSCEEKYTNYLSYIQEQIDLYNKIYSSRPNKQIHL